MSNPGFEALLEWVEAADGCDRQIRSKRFYEDTRPFLEMRETRGSMRYSYMLTPEECRNRVCVEHAAQRIDYELSRALGSAAGSDGA